MTKRVLFILIGTLGVSLFISGNSRSPIPARGDQVQSEKISSKLNSKDGLSYAWIAPGSFMMGCTGDDCFPNDRPPHKVTLTAGFWMGTTEATTGAYKRFVKEVGRDMPPESAEGMTVNTGWKNDRLPIVNVNWNDASDYCKWAGGRLPSEAQWEYAARGGSSEDYYGPLDEIAWTASNSGRERLDSNKLFTDDKAHYMEALTRNGNTVHEVAKKRPNRFGLYDMIGNVAEYTNDWFEMSYYAHSPERDPTGPASGDARVSRGGHFIYPDKANRVSKRLWNDPEGRSPIIGFRCVMSEVR